MHPFSLYYCNSPEYKDLGTDRILREKDLNEYEYKRLAEELTALSELKWNDKEHIFLVGNHELGLHDLTSLMGYLFLQPPAE